MDKMKTQTRCSTFAGKAGRLFLALFMLGLFSSTVHAAIAVDASSPIRFTGTPLNNVDITSASFTPPDNSVLLVMVDADTDGASITVSVSDSTALSWTQIVERDLSDGGAQQGHASASYAVVATGSSMTVRVRRTAGNGVTNRISAKVYVITGADTSDPIGASDEGSSTTNNITPTIFTSTVNNSRGFGTGNEWGALGLPSSTDEEDAADYPGHISVISAYKASDTPASSTAVTMNFDAGNAPGVPTWNWVGVEILPAPPAPTGPVQTNVISGDSVIGGTSSLNY